MIKIFNNKLRSKIRIDENADWIQFTPKDYEDKPFVIIEMRHFNFSAHSKNCFDCRMFLDSFGTESLDWYISYFNKTFRLNTEQVGQIDYPANEIKYIISDYEQGTKMTLVFHKIPTDKNELQSFLELAVENEDYKSACVLRDLIEEDLEW